MHVPTLGVLPTGIAVRLLDRSQLESLGTHLWGTKYCLLRILRILGPTSKQELQCPALQKLPPVHMIILTISMMRQSLL